MKLNYKRFGSGEPLIIMHGLLGMLDNWMSLGKEYAEHFDVILIDARNHGHSPWSDDHNYQLMMEDIDELISDLSLGEVNILGHSMGGKAVMKYAQNYPLMVNKLIVADIAPKSYKPHHQQIMAGLKNVPLNQLEKRTEADEYLAEYIPEMGVRAFLMKSLYWKEKGQLAWRFNLDVLEKSLVQVGEAIMDAPFDGESLFIRGSKSNYILDSDIEDIKAVFHDVQFETLEGAGHWLHAEKREAFLEKTLQFLLA